MKSLYSKPTPYIDRKMANEVKPKNATEIKRIISSVSKIIDRNNKIERESRLRGKSSDFAY